MNEKAMIERLLSPRTISQHMTRADLFAALELDRKEAAEMLRKVVADRDALRAELETLRMQEPIHIEEVAEIVGTAEGCALDWLVEGGPSGFPKGVTLLVDDGRVTDANGEGEVYLAAGAQSVPNGWRPIETAPKGARGYAWMMLAWGAEDDPHVAAGMRCGDKFFAAATFYCLGQEKQYEMREIEVHPTHWMPLPAAPKEDDQ